MLSLAVGDTPNELGCFGVWSEQPSGVSISSVASSSTSIGVISGNNEQAVPLLSHTHTNSSGESSVEYQKSGQIRTGTPSSTSTGVVTYPIPDNGFSSSAPTGRSTPYTRGVSISNVATTAPVNVDITINETDEPSPTIDVKGKIINAVLWLRTA